MKHASLSIGIILVLLALFTLVPNALIGSGGYFYSDLWHNLILFFSGAILIIVALKFDRLIGKTFRIMGVFYLAFAVLGALTVGFAEYDRVLGLVGSNGPDHLAHLVLGLLLVVLGTKEIRLPLEASAESDAVLHSELHS